MNQFKLNIEYNQKPFYYYDLGLLSETLNVINEESEDYHIHYALKANANPEILKRICESGMGADCVSGNEVLAALDAGFPKEKVVFAGVGKTDREISLAIDNEIGCMNCESSAELLVINFIAENKDKRVPVALRINPDLSAGTHEKITTGTKRNKFGISEEELPVIFQLLRNLKNIDLIGLHFHIGSQITDLDVFQRLAMKGNDMFRLFEEQGFSLKSMNFGGGLGIDYNDPDGEPIADFSSYFSTFRSTVKLPDDVAVHFEPGRSVVAQCGSLITEVLYIKNGEDRDFAIIDAGMTELLRPALYDATHKIQLVGDSLRRIVKNYHVAGPVCESSDCFGDYVALPDLKRGDRLAIRSTGAYGEVMSLGYNLRDKVHVIFSEETEILV